MPNIKNNIPKQPLRVLVVDDTILYRTLISEVLTAIPDVEVVGTAAHGEIALAKIAELAPDLITLDVEMPVMDGLTTLKRLQNLKTKVVVVMVSAHTIQGAAIVPPRPTRSQTAQDWFGRGLQKSGSIIRGFTVGTNRDASLSSGLRLQLSGELADDVHVVAALSDAALHELLEGRALAPPGLDPLVSGLGADSRALGAGGQQRSGHEYQAVPRVEGFHPGRDLIPVEPRGQAAPPEIFPRVGGGGNVTYPGLCWRWEITPLEQI